MKKIYRIILMIFHCIGLLVISAANFSRFCFFSTWPPRDDLILLLLFVILFAVHYGLLFLGCMLKCLSRKFLNTLTIAEIIYCGFQLTLVTMFYINPLIKPSLYAVLPMLVSPVIMLAFRMPINKKLIKTGDGLCEP